MKTKIFAISILIACLVLPMSLSAQGNLMTGTAKAEIRKPLIIINDPLVGAANALNFGIVAPGSANGTYLLSTTNTQTLSNGITVSTAAATSPASFELSGSAGKTYVITLGASSVTINGTSGNALTNTASMTVDAFTVRPQSSGGVDQLNGTIDAVSGKDKFSVGATLHVSSTQDEGQYAGTFSVTANYN